MNKYWVYVLATKTVIVCFIASVALLIWRYSSLPPSIPIWFSRAWGVDRLDSPVWLWVLSGSMIGWHTINIILSRTILKPYRVFIQALFVSSIFVSVMTLFIIANILFLVS